MSIRKATEPRFIGDLHTAIMRERPITITYLEEEKDRNGIRTGRKDENGNPVLSETVRTIEPYSIIKVESSGNHLIKTMDRESGQHRSWRLDRIQTYTVHRGRFLIERPESAAERALRELERA
jgi:predicted DNA-binding transcriptional regulator YafY